MNHTTNYQLNQWEATDRVTRDDFNADNAAIDTALKTVADAAAAAQSAVSGAVKLVTGSYTGNGAESRTINVGFAPKAVLLFTQQGQTYYVSGTNYYMCGGLILPNKPIRYTDLTVAAISGNGFTVSYKNAGIQQIAFANQSSVVYYYAALG